MADSMPKVTLYTYFRSSCSARLRIALGLKSIPYTSVAVNLLKDEQLSPSHVAINPSGSVPALIIENAPSSECSASSTVTITQSLAALEYLEDAFPSTTSTDDSTSAPAPRSLLPPPSCPERRALVRTLASIIACDVQPVTNLRILKRVAAVGFDRAAWSKELIEEGFRAYEAIASKCAGRFSVGDDISMADVCLIPAVWGAERVGVSLDTFPTIKRIAERLEEEEAVKKGHWRTQEDTPAEFRLKP